MKILDYDPSAAADCNNLFYCDSWITVLRDCYAYPFKMVCDPDLLLIFAEVHDVYGRRLISMPFSDYTEPPAADNAKLLDVLDFLKREYPQSTILLRLRQQRDDLTPIGFQCIRQALCHRIDLAAGPDAVWQKTDRHFKKGVRKAREDGVRVQTENSEEGVTIFYDMLTRLRRHKFKIIPQSKDFYATLFTQFVQQGLGNIWLAYHHDKPVASAFVLHCANAMFDKMGVSDQDHLDVRPNNLLLWEIISYGVEHRFEYLDMGLSQTDYEGLIRFKDSLGGQRSPINFYRYLPPDHDAVRDAELKKMFTEVTHFLVESDLPDAALQHASQFLYRYFC